MTMMKVTPSVQGGVVSEPTYCRTEEEAILEMTSVKSTPVGIAILSPGVAIERTWGESDRIREFDGPIDT